MATEVECTLCASIGQMGSAANKEPDHFANYAYGDGGDDDDDNDDDDDDGAMTMMMIMLSDDNNPSEIPIVS